MRKLPPPPPVSRAEVVDLKMALAVQAARARTRLLARQAVDECVRRLWLAVVEAAAGAAVSEWADAPLSCQALLDEDDLSTTDDQVLRELVALLRAAGETAEKL